MTREMYAVILAGGRGERFWPMSTSRKPKQLLALVGDKGRAERGYAAALESLGGRPAILEAKATFVRELSVIAARDWDGHMAVYPLGENRHEGGVLRTTLAPAAGLPTGHLQLELSGSAFTRATAVTFNGAPVVGFTVVDDGRIRDANGNTVGRWAVVPSDFEATLTVPR